MNIRQVFNLLLIIFLLSLLLTAWFAYRFFLRDRSVERSAPSFVLSRLQRSA